MQVKESKTNWHFRISVAKSILRIAAGLALCKPEFLMAGILFVVAEMLGIAEEF